MNARNGIAHSDPQGIQKAEAAGFTLSQLATIRRFRSSMDGLASGMDAVVGNYLHRLLGGTPPW